MRLSLRILLVLWVSGNLLGAFAQDTTVRSGFAITTLVSGNIAGLAATENLINNTLSGVSQAIVPASPLVTTASLLVTVGPIGENTTGISIANPSAGFGLVNLFLTDTLGNPVLNTTIQLSPFGHFAQFLNELFIPQSFTVTTPLLLTVSSEIPVAVLALNFRGNDFSPIPLTSLSAPTAVPVQPLSPLPPISAFLPPVTPLTGFGLGVPQPAPIPIFSTPATVTNSLVPTTASIGGAGAIVFAEVATGGGWSTQISIGNTSAVTQTVRIDFFDTNGANTSSLTNILIPSQGVFMFSTDAAVQGQ